MYEMTRYKIKRETSQKCLKFAIFMSVSPHFSKRDIMEKGSDVKTGIPLFDNIKGRYEIIKIADHDIRRCFYVQDNEERKCYVLKVFQKSAFVGQQERILNEISAAKMIDSPFFVNIISTCYNDELDDNFWFMYNFIAGKSLNSILYTTKTEPYFDLFVAWAVAKMVEVMHQHNIIHRDIKPENIVVDKEGFPHLLDYGDVGVVDDDGVRRKKTGQHGSVLYSPPEVFGGDFFNVKSDVFSLGGTIFSIVAREAPFYDLWSLESPYDVSKIPYMKQYSDEINTDDVSTREDWETVVTNFIKGKIFSGFRDTRYNQDTEKYKNLPEYHQKLIDVVLLCWNGDCEKRPGIDEVIKMIEEASEFLPAYDKDMFESFRMIFEKGPPLVKRKDEYGSFDDVGDTFKAMDCSNLKEIKTLFTKSIMKPALKMTPKTN